MATSLSELRKSRSSIMDKIVKELDSGGNRNQDDRFWTLTRDKAGNGSAVIRILPFGNDIPWVKHFSYGFKGPTGRWYINASPTSINLPDPVMEYVAEAYSSKDENRIKDVKENQKRRKQYIANILVIKDPANPENDGKVMLWKFGSKILDMIKSKAKPEFEDQDPCYVWDIDEGCNMKLRMKQVAGFPNYDSTEWAAPSPIADSDKEIESILDKTFDISEFIAPSFFKSYDELKKEFERVMYGTGTQQTAESRSSKESNEPAFDLDAEVKKAASPARKVEKKEVKIEDDDDDLDAFKKMLEDI